MCAPYLSSDTTCVRDLTPSLPTSHLTPLPLQVEAHRRLNLAHLPVVLILHLKRFLFDKTGGSQKLQKQVQYSMQLEVGKGEEESDSPACC